MVTDTNRFVKLPFDILNMDMPAECKILFSILSDKITYSKYTDDRGRYYFLSGKERIVLMQIVGCKRETFMKHVRLLKEKGLIYSYQHGHGSRIYLPPRWSKKSTTEKQEVENSDYQSAKIPTTEVVEKTDFPINQKKQNKLTNQITDIYENVYQ